MASPKETIENITDIITSAQPAAQQLRQIHDILNELEQVDNPCLVEVEFKPSTIAFLDGVKADFNDQLTTGQLISLIIERSIAAYRNAKVAKP